MTTKPINFEKIFQRTKKYLLDLIALSRYDGNYSKVNELEKLIKEYKDATK